MGPPQDPPAQDGAGWREGAHGEAASLRLRRPVPAHVPGARGHATRFPAQGGGLLAPRRAAVPRRGGRHLGEGRDHHALPAGAAGGGGDPHDGGSRGPPRAAVRRPRGEGSRGGVAGIQRSADGDHPAAGSLVLDGGGAIRPGSAVGGGPGDPPQGPVGRRRWRGGPPDEARRATAGGVAPSEPAQERPRPKAVPATPGEQVDYSPAVQLVEAPPRGQGPGVGDDPTAREDLIYNEKGTKVHRPDPAEASTEPFLWRSRCGAWPYGIRRFFRVSEKPAAAAWCARCFPAPAGGDGEGSPTEPVDSPVASSSASESDSSSS